MAILMCAAIWSWSAERDSAERHGVLRQTDTIAGVLASAHVQQIRDRLGAGPGDQVGWGEGCSFCLRLLRARTDAADVDVGPALLAMARLGPGPHAVAALVADDGVARVMHADGSITTDRVRDADPARLVRGPDHPDMHDSDGRERAYGSAPLGPALALAIGVDLTSSMAAQRHRGRQDEVWAVGTMLLLLLATGVVSTLVEWAGRRDRRLTDDRVQLTLANAELKSAGDRARAQSIELQTIFTSMSDGMSHFDAELRLVGWNDQFAELAGVPHTVLRVGVPVADLLRAQAAGGEFGALPTSDAIEAEVARRLVVLRTATPLHVVERPRPDGRTIELRRASLPSGGWVTIYSDITERRQVEAVREAARAQAERTADEKARLAAIVSHEIRTPLNVALNALGLIDRDGLPTDQRRLVETGLQAGNALLALVNDILDLSRLESGRLAITPAPFALRPMVEGVADMYRPLTQSRGMEITVCVQGAVPANIRADMARLRQMLLNLVGNAAKFADLGTIRIEAGILADRLPVLRIAVSDSGPVIAAGDRARLFRPFSQLDRSTSDGQAGTGLGLSICSMLARRMGGEISYEAGGDASDARGNTFVIQIPLEPPAPADADATVCAAGPPSRSRVLVAEDVLANQALLAAMLRRDGHVVDVVDTGEAAVEAASACRYDLVLMDVMMPGLTGLEATRRIRALPGASSCVPIVGVTAHASDADRADCLDAGMTDVLVKPLDPVLLARAIRLRSVHRADAADPEGGPCTLDRARLGALPRADELLGACLADLRLQFEALEDAAIRGDVSLLSTTAHAMSGAAANHGFVRLAAGLRPLLDARAVQTGVRERLGMIAHDIEEAAAELSRSELAEAD